MYPENLTELVALIGILTPLIIAAIAGLWNVRTKSFENDLIRWRRINELAATLYNKDHAFGLWAQLAAAYELGHVARPHKEAAKSIITAARIQFVGNLQLSQALTTALKTLG